MSSGAGARPDPTRLRATLAALVRIPSVNPAFSGGATDERAIALHLRDAMAALGMETHWHESLPGRASVVGRLRGEEPGPTLLLYGHHDTVGVEGMPDPFEPRVEGNRMYGRGVLDMKGGIAASLEAIRATVEAGVPIRGELLLAFVADEEEASRGMEEVLRHHRADAAVVTEPTSLELVVAHNGFEWVEVETVGRAAHGSLWAEGIDANLRMGRLLARLDALRGRLATAPGHPLTGPRSLHAATLHGGTGWSTYADRCTLRLERRTLPGEPPGTAAAEVEAAVAALRAEDPSFEARVRPILARPAWEARSDSRVVEAVDAAARGVLGVPPRRSGVGYWMDTALIAAAGIDAVAIGAGGGGAHAPEEWTDLDSVHRLARILAATVAGYLDGG